MGFFDKILNPHTVAEDGETENIQKVASEKASDLIKTLAGGKIQYTKKVVDNVIVFTNASGGTGASTVASNVAYMATKAGLRVLVIDLNIMYPIQHNYFGTQEIEKPDLVSFLMGKNTLGDSIDTTGNTSLLIANNRSLMESINCETQIVISNFIATLDKIRPLFDLIIIDAPMRVDHTLINHTFYNCDQIYIVWDESLSSIANTERIRRNMAVSGIEAYSKMQVILNKKTDVHYSKYPFEKLNIELAQILPFDTSIIESGLRGQIFCQKGSSTSKNANAFYEGIENLTYKILENGGYVK